MNKQNQQALKAQRALEKNIQSAYRSIFRNSDKDINVAGREVLADLRNFCYVTKESNTSDPIELAKIEGRRAVMYRIMSWLELDFDAIYGFEADYTPYDEELF